MLNDYVRIISEMFQETDKIEYCSSPVRGYLGSKYRDLNEVLMEKLENIKKQIIFEHLRSLINLFPGTFHFFSSDDTNYFKQKSV